MPYAEDVVHTRGYHSFGMWWDPDASPAFVDFFIDGRLGHSIARTTSDLVANEPMYMILSSGTWAPASRGGAPDATTVFPNAFQADWVRAHAQAPAQPGYSAPWQG